MDKKNCIDQEEAYYHLEGVISSINIELLPFLGKFKTKELWEQYGFNIVEDEHGNIEPFEKNGLWYGFNKYSKKSYRWKWSEEIENAIKLDKRYAYSPKDILNYKCVGVDYSEFEGLTDDKISYSEACIFFENEKYQNALVEIEKSISFNNQSFNHFYIDVYFETRLKLEDLSAIDDEINSYPHEIPALIHGGRIDKWIELLLSKNEIKKTYELINKISEMLDKISRGEIINPDFKKYYKENSEKYLSLIEDDKMFAKNKKEYFNKYLSKLIKLKKLNKTEIKKINATDFFALIEKVPVHESISDYNFYEKVGDIFCILDNNNLAFKYYKISYTKIPVEKKMVIKRIEKKIKRIDNEF